jgi:glycosyltransferase involved in cell wall biosynthesis
VKLVVAILTYRRPAELALGLPLVIAQVRDFAVRTGTIASVLVVDNDAAGSARATVDSLTARAIGVPVRYVVEAEPGIAAARNRAIDETSSSDVLVFIDDDEHPLEHWIEPLVDTWQRTGATAVMGRVVSEFGTALDPWVAAGEFFRRRSMPTGTEITVAAAGNLLLDRVQVHRLGVRFDHRLGLGAGEDSLFSQELVRRGGRIAWCEESVAVDRVPADRMSRRWVLDRARSHGNAETVVGLHLANSVGRRGVVRARAAVRGSVRVAGGTARYLYGLASGSLRHQARGMRTAHRGLGIVAGAAGHVVEEYAR